VSVEVVLTEVAREEIREARRWYSRIDPGLGRDLARPLAVLKATSRATDRAPLGSRERAATGAGLLAVGYDPARRGDRHGSLE
jgi:hypothetical protein